MKRLKHQMVKAVTVIATILVAFTVMPVRANAAEGPLLKDYDGATAINKFVYFGFDKDTIQTDIPFSMTGGELSLSDAGTKFTAKYPDSLDYFGKKLSVKVDITFDGGNSYGFNRLDTKTSLWINSGSDAGRGKNSVWMKAFGADFTVTVTIYQDNGFVRTFNDFVGAISFLDPDEANYYYTTGNYPIYYDNKDNVGSKYYVESNGLERDTWGNIADAEIGVALFEDPTFTFKINGHGDWIYLPDFIIVEAPYKVEYYYQNNDGSYPTTPESTSELRYSNIYENPKAKVTDEDKVSKKTGYDLDENMDEEWEKEYLTDGTTVLKVYFRPSYTIKYDGNGGTLPEGKEMPDDVYFADEDETMPSKQEWLYERPGYEFTGFKLENKGDTKNGSVDYRDVLIEEDDREIVLYAQWTPLNYKIIYNKNAVDATGEMADNNYTGADETMPSDETWTFERPGYEFKGYRVENTGDTLTDPQDFREMLLKEEDREVELYAQWEPLPYKIKYNKNAEDATGEMKDDDYTGADPNMPSKENWTFEREGYDFTGFKLENKGDTKNGSIDYRDVLIAEEDREIELFAQWEPWKYTIKYDPNGGEGVMDDHIYKYNDPNMNSDPNKYTRKGYTFEGFVYTDPEGKATLYKNISDFKEILVALGKNSEITLVAQWRKIPETKGYALPVTGVK